MIQILAIVQNKGIGIWNIDAKMFDEDIRRFVNFRKFFFK